MIYRDCHGQWTIMMIHQTSLQNKMECKTVCPSSECIAGSWSQLRILFEVCATLWCYLAGFDFKMFWANGFGYKITCACKISFLFAQQVQTPSHSRYKHVSLCLLDIAASPFWFSQQFRGLMVLWRFHFLYRVYIVACMLPTIFQQLSNSKVNNYAKFVLLPMLISLGINYAWLDIDIFLAQNPTSRLLELAESADVLTTDHFDETCLNHGVTLILIHFGMRRGMSMAFS